MNMRPDEVPAVNVVLVAPIFLLRSLLQRILQQNGGINPSGDQATDAGDGAELPHIVVEPISSENLERLAHLSEQSSPIPILIGCDKTTLDALLRGEDVAPRNLFHGLSSEEQLFDALLSAVKGDTSGHQLDVVGEDANPPHTRKGLTRREMDVLQWLAEGASNRQIAASLKISVYTVYTHVKHIQFKLGTTNRTQTAVVASTLVARS